ncbi:MAG: diguanylate cyclase [Syntrophomonadaceae bacterium]|nr:diguanylate cyclase [Syntrophomonadaceae bacterium]
MGDQEKTKEQLIAELVETRQQLERLQALEESNRSLLEELRISEAKYRAVVEDQTELICRSLPDGTLTFVNEAYCRYFGRTGEELIGKNFFELIPPEDHEKVREKINSFRVERPVVTYEHKVYSPDGDVRWQQWTDRAIFNPEGAVIELQSVGRDITERKTIEDALRTNEERLSSILNCLEDVVYSICPKTFKLLYISPAVEKLYKIPSHEFFNNPFLWLEAVHPDDRERVAKNFKGSFFINGSFQEEYRIICPDGEIRWVSNRASLLRDNQGHALRIDGLTSDITKRKKAEIDLRQARAELEIRIQERTRELKRINEELLNEISERKRIEAELRYISYHDELTGLYNRRYFEMKLQGLESGGCSSVGLIICDVDGLKFINDTRGHSAGDHLLKKTVEIIKQCLGEGDVLARIGGDEFAVLLTDCTRSQVEELIQRIYDLVESYNRQSKDIPISISLGYAICKKPEMSITRLYKEADNNMYRTKLQQSQNARSSLVNALMQTLRARNLVTEGHADRLQALMTRLARAISLTERSISDLRLLAQFHDIGKIGIPDRILFKPGPFTEEERQEMQRHCEIGHRIALSSLDLAPIADYILKHHEWWNGKGYPFGLKGGEIPLECRILAIADAYEAMTSGRPYRKALAHGEAVVELRRCAGSQFDPGLVEEFIRLFE